MCITSRYETWSQGAGDEAPLDPCNTVPRHTIWLPNECSNVSACSQGTQDWWIEWHFHSVEKIWGLVISIIKRFLGTEHSFITSMQALIWLYRTKAMDVSSPDSNNRCVNNYTSSIARFCYSERGLYLLRSLTHMDMVRQAGKEWD